MTFKRVKIKKTGEIKKLGVFCTSSDCDKGLHCFRPTRKMKQNNEIGKCRSCKADLVDWPRIHKRDLNDFNYLYDMLNKEQVRYEYWRKNIDDEAINYSNKKGLEELEKRAKKIIENKLSIMDIYWDGRQTPKDGNIIYYAQHAVACCCRKCIEYWHGIPRSETLSETQIKYFVELIMKYIKIKLPSLN